MGGGFIAITNLASCSALPGTSQSDRSLQVIALQSLQFLTEEKKTGRERVCCRVKQAYCPGGGIIHTAL